MTTAIREQDVTAQIARMCRYAMRQEMTGQMRMVLHVQAGRIKSVDVEIQKKMSTSPGGANSLTFHDDGLSCAAG